MLQTHCPYCTHYWALFSHEMTFQNVLYLERPFGCDLFHISIKIYKRGFKPMQTGDIRHQMCPDDSFPFHNLVTRHRVRNMSGTD